MQDIHFFLYELTNIKSKVIKTYFTLERENNLFNSSFNVFHAFRAFHKILFNKIVSKPINAPKKCCSINAKGYF